MYLDLVALAVTSQDGLARAYIASGRVMEVGFYLLAMTCANLVFFQQVTPPDEWRHLHEAFIKWQELGVEALQDTLDRGDAEESPMSRRYIEASQQFADALAATSH
jgi:hypothetical protein